MTNTGSPATQIYKTTVRKKLAMATITFTTEAQEYNDWLAEEEVYAVLNELPEDIKLRLFEFGDHVVNTLGEIETAIDNAIEAVESAASCVDEMSSYAYSAESDLETATSELGGL